MVCHKCNEPIDVGDAAIPYPLNGSGRYWFFHTECKAAWDNEQERQATRLRLISQLAGTVH